MKSLMMFLLVILTMASAAADNLRRCSGQVEEQYLTNARPSDIIQRWVSRTELPADAVIRNQYGLPLARFPYPVLQYMVSGSYHSGWFADLVVAHPRSCEILFVGEYAAE
jgi:hypothetical protein